MAARARAGSKKESSKTSRDFINWGRHNVFPIEGPEMLTDARSTPKILRLKIS